MRNAEDDFFPSSKKKKNQEKEQIEEQMNKRRIRMRRTRRETRLTRTRKKRDKKGEGEGQRGRRIKKKREKKEKEAQNKTLPLTTPIIKTIIISNNNDNNNIDTQFKDSHVCSVVWTIKYLMETVHNTTNKLSQHEKGPKIAHKRPTQCNVFLKPKKQGHRS